MIEAHLNPPKLNEVPSASRYKINTISSARKRYVNECLRRLMSEHPQGDSRLYPFDDGGSIDDKRSVRLLRVKTGRDGSIGLDDGRSLNER